MKKIVITMMIFVLFSTLGFAEHNFEDVPGNHWAEDYIYELRDRHVIEGKSPTKFDPDGNLTVAAAIKMVIVGNTKTEYMPRTQGEWYTPYVEVAYEMELIKDGEFERFDRNITRNEVARILIRGTGLDPSPLETTFSDNDLIPGGFRGFVKTAVDLGYIEGYKSDNTFRGDNLLTRAEMSKLTLVNIKYLESIKTDDKPVVDNTELDKLKKRLEEEGNPVVDDTDKDFEDVVIPESTEFNPRNVVLTQEDYDRLYAYEITPADVPGELTFEELNKSKLASDFLVNNFAVQNYMFNHVNNIFSRDYTQQSFDEYYHEVEKYYGNYYYYDDKEYFPTDFVNFWVEDTYKNKVISEFVFINDEKLFSTHRRDKMYRGILYFRYTNHDKPEEIYKNFEEIDFKNFELNKWYQVDTDIVMEERSVEPNFEHDHIELNNAKFYKFIFNSEFKEVIE